MKLTHIACKSAEPREKAYKVTDGGGLYLYVMPNGSKYWHFKYHYAGKEKRLALGVYPEISLQMAREKRLKACRLLDEGVDPGLEKKRMKYQRVESVCLLFLTSVALKRELSPQGWKKSLGPWKWLLRRELCQR